jgi:putative endonuclease
MKSANLTVGVLGEAVAKRYLRRRGYRIIAQNYRTKYSEIDLIFSNKKTLVFVEVRTKVQERFGAPEESLKADKIKRLIRAAAAYVTRRNYTGSYRIDVVCIVLDETKAVQRLSHYQNITLI